LRLLILVAREGFLKDECGPRAKKFEHHCPTVLKSLVQWSFLKSVAIVNCVCWNAEPWLRTVIQVCSLMYHVIKVTEVMRPTWIQSLFLTYHCYL